MIIQAEMSTPEFFGKLAIMNMIGASSPGSCERKK